MWQVSLAYFRMHSFFPLHPALSVGVGPEQGFINLRLPFLPRSSSYRFLAKAIQNRFLHVIYSSTHSFSGLYIPLSRICHLLPQHLTIIQMVATLILWSFVLAKLPISPTSPEFPTSTSNSVCQKLSSFSLPFTLMCPSIQWMVPLFTCRTIYPGATLYSPLHSPTTAPSKIQTCHVSAPLKTLQWFPIVFRIQSKLFNKAYKSPT